MFDFEKFKAYQKAEEFYQIVVFDVLKDKSIDKIIKDQLRRASLSIVLNIAEGAGKFSRNDKKNFYAISRGSVNECVAVLRILKIEGKILNDVFSRAYNLLLEMAKMLSALILNMNNKTA